MQRAVSRLSRAPYDLAVIGGGIYGAFVAWDAAQRGLKVALVDQADFAGATSSNSQKIIHGGLRYLQHADLVRMRESIRERSVLMRIAPHLVHTMPVLMPTFRSHLRGRTAMRFALKANDLISLDRNRDLPLSKYIPNGRTISRSECLQRVPGLETTDLTGGAIFYDAQVYNSERLILSILRSAADAGADLANYVQVTGLKPQGGRVSVLCARDTLAGDTVEIQTRTVVNCSGPWIDHTFETLAGKKPAEPTGLFKAFLLVTRKFIPDMALGVPLPGQYRDDDAIADKGFRFLFVTPWRHTSIVGAFYAPHHGPPQQCTVTPEEIQEALQEINKACPTAQLTSDDVYLTYVGLLPQGASDSSSIQYAKHYRIHDHEKNGGPAGLISVMGVKYTTARDVAEKSVDLVLRKLGSKGARCSTAMTPLHGGDVTELGSAVKSAESYGFSGVTESTLSHLIRTYGSEYQSILDLCNENPEWIKPLSSETSVVGAEVINGIRNEMAQKFADVVFRRTELGTAGHPGDAAIRRCASIMAAESGWSQQKTAQEIAEAAALFT